MLVLAVDCTFGGHSVAVLRDKETVASAHKPGVHATEGAIESIDRALARAGAALGDLDAVACGVGPGLFSGIRAACGMSQGIAHAHGLRVAPVGSMLALAHASGCSKAVVAYPAHRGHCYLAAYERSGGGLAERLPPSLHRLDALPKLRGDWQVCARRLSRSAKELAACVAGKATAARAWRGSLATAVGRLGTDMALRGLAVDPADALPIYVRDKVASTIEERRAGKPR